MISVIDLATTNEYDSQWTEFLVHTSLSTDALAENYLELIPQNFLSFPTVIKDNKIICFSGLQIDNNKLSLIHI